MARRLKSAGLIWDRNGGAWQGHFLSDRNIRKTVLERLLDKDEIQAFRIEGMPEIFYACKELDVRADGNGQEDYARFIAPLDNLMWDRAMVEKLFDFSYRWEVDLQRPLCGKI